MKRVCLLFVVRCNHLLARPSDLYGLSYQVVRAADGRYLQGGFSMYLGRELVHSHFAGIPYRSLNRILYGSKGLFTQIYGLRFTVAIGIPHKKYPAVPRRSRCAPMVENTADSPIFQAVFCAFLSRIENAYIQKIEQT